MKTIKKIIRNIDWFIDIYIIYFTYKRTDRYYTYLRNKWGEDL